MLKSIDAKPYCLPLEIIWNFVCKVSDVLQESGWRAPGGREAARARGAGGHVPAHPGAAPDSDDEPDAFTPTDILNEVDEPNAANS